MTGALRRNMKDPAFRIAYEQRRMVHEVARAVRAMRAAAGLTQKQLAELIGAHQPMIARLERGSDSRRPRWDTLQRIAAVLERQLTLTFSEPGAREPRRRIEVRGVNLDNSAIDR
jgi:transcriptional regulator with XRE-family HTH domain